MLDLDGARVAEAVYRAALRVNTGEHVLDAAILAGGVHGLKDDQQRLAAGSVEALLQVAHTLDVLLEQRLVLALVGV